MKLETITMTELLDDVYEARLPIIKNLLYPGAYIFAGPPKVGKSFMVAQIGYHVSKGMPLWDMEVSKGTVLYLALEDVNERLQQRLAKMFPSLEDNDNFYFATKSEVLNKGLMEQLNGFVESHKNTKMIIIDTLQKIKDNVRDSSDYANDYDIIAKLKNFADKHHTRKQESNDSFDMISGTQWEIKRMAYDFKKDSKEFYRSKNKPEIVNVPKANYIAARGSGDPNEEGGAYQQAISVLYAVAYTLKMSYKTDYKIKGFYEYVVPPLEGFWWQENVSGVDYSDKFAFCWILVIRVPDFVSEKDFDWAVKNGNK